MNACNIISYNNCDWRACKKRRELCALTLNCSKHVLLMSIINFNVNVLSAEHLW